MAEFRFPRNIRNRGVYALPSLSKLNPTHPSTLMSFTLRSLKNSSHVNPWGNDEAYVSRTPRSKLQQLGLAELGLAARSNSYVQLSAQA